MYKLRTCLVFATLCFSLSVKAYIATPAPVTFSPDSKKVAIFREEDFNLRIWDVEAGKEIFKLPHDRRINSYQYNSDGKLIVTASDDGFARIFDGETGKALQAIKHNAPVKFAGLVHNSQLLFTYSKGGSAAHLWNANTGTQVQSFKADFAITYAGVSSDSKYIYVASDNMEDWNKSAFQVWEIDSGAQIFHQNLENNYYTNAWIPANSDHLLRIGRQGQVFDLKTGKLLFTFEGGAQSPDDNKLKVGLSPDEKKIITLDDKTMHIIDAGTGSELAKTDLGSTASFPMFSPDNKYIFLKLDSYAYYQQYDITTGVHVRSVGQGMLNSGYLAFSNNGKFADFDFQLLQIADLATDKLINSFSPLYNMGHVEYNQNGSQVLTVSSLGDTADCIVRIYDAATGKEIYKSDSVRGDCRYVIGNFSPDGKYVFVGAQESFDPFYKYAKVLSTTDFHEVNRLSGAQTITLNPMSNFAIIQGDWTDTYGFAVDLRDFSLHSYYSSDESIIDGVAMGEKDKTIVVHKNIGGYEVYDTKSGKLLSKYDVEEGRLSTDGKYLLSRCQQLNSANGKVVRQIPCDGPTYSFSYVFSDDSSKVAAISESNNVYTVKIYQFPAWTEISRFDVLGEIHYPILNFSRDNKVIRSQGDNGYINLWDVNTGQQIRTLAQHGLIISSGLNYDGSKVVMSSADGVAKIWDGKLGTSLIDLVPEP